MQYLYVHAVTDLGVSEMCIWYADHSSVSCKFRHMQRIWLFQSFSPPHSPLPTFPESQVNIKYSLLPWWQPKCWCAKTHVYNLHFLCPALPYQFGVGNLVRSVCYDPPRTQYFVCNYISPTQALVDAVWGESSLLLTSLRPSALPLQHPTRGSP